MKPVWERLAEKNARVEVLLNNKCSAVTVEVVVSQEPLPAVDFDQCPRVPLKWTIGIHACGPTAVALRNGDRPNIPDKYPLRETRREIHPEGIVSVLWECTAWSELLDRSLDSVTVNSAPSFLKDSVDRIVSFFPSSELEPRKVILNYVPSDVPDELILKEEAALKTSFGTEVKEDTHVDMLLGHLLRIVNIGNRSVSLLLRDELKTDQMFTALQNDIRFNEFLVVRRDIFPQAEEELLETVP